MPIRPEWDQDAQIWTLTTGQIFDLAEISDLIERTDWKGATRYLWDFERLEKGPDSRAELRQAVDLVQRTGELWAGSRAAILVARDVDFGIARMFSAFAEQVDVEYRVFRDRQLAIDWLRSPDSS